MLDGLAIGIVATKGYVYFLCNCKITNAMAKTRPLTYQAIAWTFARLVVTYVT